MYTAQEASDLAATITDAVFEMLSELHEVMELPECPAECVAYESVRLGLREIREMAEPLAARSGYRLCPLEGSTETDALADLLALAIRARRIARLRRYGSGSSVRMLEGTPFADTISALERILVSDRFPADG